MRFIDMVAVAQESAQKRRASKEKIAGMQFIDNQEIKNRGALDLQGLRNEGDVNVQGLRNEGAVNIQGLANKGDFAVQGLRNEGAVDVATLREDGSNFRHQTLSANQDSINKTSLTNTRTAAQIPDWKMIYDGNDNPTGAFNARGAVNPMPSDGVSDIEAFVRTPRRTGDGAVRELANSSASGDGTIQEAKKSALAQSDPPPQQQEIITKPPQPGVLGATIPMTPQMAALRDEPQPIIEAFKPAAISPEEKQKRMERRRKRMGSLVGARNPYRPASK